MAILLPQWSLAQQKFAKNNVFQLSAPKIEIDSLLFIKSASIIAQRGTPGSKIYYETDNEIKELSSSLSISSSTQLKVWAEHPEFQKSDSQIIQVVKISDALANAEISLNTSPHDSYLGNGAQTLIDLKKGTTSFRADKNWLGFQDKEVEVSIKLVKEHKISKVALGVLVDQGSWIFMPSTIKIASNGKVIGQKEFPHAKKEDISKSTFITTDVEPGNYQSITLKIKSLDAIPDWHPGKGTQPWIFIDEILIEP